MTEISLFEALGVRPFRKTMAEVALALRGDGETPPSRFDRTSLRLLRPKLSVPLWLGKYPSDRIAPITNLFNYTPTPVSEGWSVRVTQASDFRGKSLTYDSHQGTDFAIPPGTLVVTSAPGRVVRVSSEFHRGGLKILVDHGFGIVTSYNHLGRALVKVGELVKRGQPIALSGMSGMDGLFAFPWLAPHVHYNVWLNGYYCDPFGRPGETSLWRAGRLPMPAEFRDLNDSTYEPTQWYEKGVNEAIDVCTHAESKEEIRSQPTLELQAVSALFHLNYYPTRFSRKVLLCEPAYPRRPLLDLPFSKRDYDGSRLIDE